MNIKPHIAEIDRQIAKLESERDMASAMEAVFPRNGCQAEIFREP
jgi:hypothetical protein